MINGIKREYEIIAKWCINNKNYVAYKDGSVLVAASYKIIDGEIVTEKITNPDEWQRVYIFLDGFIHRKIAFATKTLNCIQDIDGFWKIYEDSRVLVNNSQEVMTGLLNFTSRRCFLKIAGNLLTIVEPLSRMAISISNYNIDILEPNIKRIFSNIQSIIDESGYFFSHDEFIRIINGDGMNFEYATTCQIAPNLNVCLDKNIVKKEVRNIKSIDDYFAVISQDELDDHIENEQPKKTNDDISRKNEELNDLLDYIFGGDRDIDNTSKTI